METVVVTVSGGIAEVCDGQDHCDTIVIDYDECNENPEYAFNVAIRILDSELTYHRKMQYLHEITVKYPWS